MRAAVIDISMLSALTISPPENERDWPEAANIAIYRQRVILLLQTPRFGVSNPWKHQSRTQKQSCNEGSEWFNNEGGRRRNRNACQHLIRIGGGVHSLDQAHAEGKLADQSETRRPECCWFVEYIAVRLIRKLSTIQPATRYGPRKH